MRKLERRSVICLMLAAILLIGMGIFVVRIARNGGEWATFYGNGNVYEDGVLKQGEVRDRNGVLLAKNGNGTVIYNDDWGTRISTLHAVGDMRGNISTGALSAFKDKIIGYNPITGTYKVSGGNPRLTLAIDSQANRIAYEMMSGYKAGAIGVYDYETGEILCMVSTPSLDPQYEDEPEGEDGVYINRFLSSTVVPGSIFKTVTSLAVIENLPDYRDFQYECTGTRMVDGEEINCLHVHGQVDFYGALASSCNGAYSILTERVGAAKMDEYAEKTGLTGSYSIDGINTEEGSFEFPEDSVLNLGWAGIGQYHDMVNPCSMMVFMGAVARGGKAPVPHLVKENRIIPTLTDELIAPSSAAILTEMMKNDVESGYGEYNFQGLDLYAKTGTAEIEDQNPTGWFTGFIKNPGHPYAFCVYVEDAGEGINTAAPIANAVLQYLVGGE